MPITESTAVVFPNNVVEILKTRIIMLDPDLAEATFKRPLRESDPHQSVGIVAANWTPNEESYEMLGAPAGRHEPTLQNYFITVQAFVRDSDEERGLAIHSVLSKMIRAMLYRDTALQVGLASLSATYGGSTESTKRWGIRQQRYFSNELQGSWLYLSNLEFWLETETI
jgi:hypothetical protein